MFLTLKDKHRLENLKQLLAKEKDKDLKLMFPEIEKEWCDFHNILQSSFYHVSEMCKFMALHQLFFHSLSILLMENNFRDTLTC